MVERAAAGKAPSSPQPPEAGARRARLYGASPVAENRNRQTMSSSRCGVGWPMSRGDPVQPTLNMWPTCPWRRGADWLRASARSICRSRMCERTAPRCLFSTIVAFPGGRWIRNFGSWSRDRQTVMGGGLLSKRERICRGTEGSNPVSSSSESAANPTSVSLRDRDRPARSSSSQVGRRGAAKQTASQTAHQSPSDNATITIDARR